MKFSRIAIIYNPNSTGDSPRIARDFQALAVKHFEDMPIDLTPTKHAGHGEELAYGLAKKHKDVLIVSVSGDGGYHEVVNGAMRAVDEGDASPICAVLPGGNANDHYTSVSKRPLIDAMREDAVTQHDLLMVEFAGKRRYAHSYAGLGLTPLVAKELNDHSLNKLREMWLALKTYWSLRPFTIRQDGDEKVFDSILMVIIDRMAKHLTLAEGNEPKDGDFEVFHWPHGNKWQLTKILFKSMLGKSPDHDHATEYTFTTSKPIPMQLDGELVDLPADMDVRVAITLKKLRTIV